MPPEKRSELMGRVRQRGTSLEIFVRRALRERRLRFRVNEKKLPGSPDLVFPKWRTVLFIHGCFWHAHTCRKARLPSTNTEFWRAKQEANRSRDRRKAAQLRKLNWKVLVVWECQVLKSDRSDRNLDFIAREIRSNSKAPSRAQTRRRIAGVPLGARHAPAALTR